jgi:hypothetical protein
MICPLFRVRTIGRKRVAHRSVLGSASRPAEMTSVCFFVRPEARFSVPTRAPSVPSRAGAVKAGRRADREAGAAVGRPRLDGAEHDGTLTAVGAEAIACPSAV